MTSTVPNIVAGSPICPSLAGSLIHDTDPHIFDNLHGFEADLSRRHLAAQWIAEDGLFSYSRARIAVEGEQLLGIQIGYDAHGIAVALEPHMKTCAQVMTADQLLHHDTWWSEYGRFSILTIPDDTYYLQNLSVVPEWRGCGIGSALLEDAINTARSNGYARLHLDVYDGNPSVRLYERMGLTTIVETRIKPLETHNFPVHLRMEIKL